MAAHRIVLLIASATEIVTALGFEDQLVGRSHECDYPPSVEQLPACSTSKVTVGASSRAIDRLRARSGRTKPACKLSAGGCSRIQAERVSFVAAWANTPK